MRTNYYDIGKTFQNRLSPVIQLSEGEFQDPGGHQDLLSTEIPICRISSVALRVRATPSFSL